MAELRSRTESLGLDISKFWRTYDHWKAGILNYLDGHYTSDAVEGINNKARVITNRCYGGEVVGHAVEPADPGPEPRVGGGWAEYRSPTRDRLRPEGRISRVLHREPEEPERFDRLLCLDGDEEFVLYLAPVGKV